jgi:hypothetical protein
VLENVKLITLATEFLKQEDIKWVLSHADFHIIIPENTVWHKKNGIIYCHIEDYEKFYLTNITNILKSTKLSTDTATDDGWTVVYNRRKAKESKINQIKKELKIISTDWNIL